MYIYKTYFFSSSSYMIKDIIFPDGKFGFYPCIFSLKKRPAASANAAGRWREYVGIEPT